MQVAVLGLTELTGPAGTRQVEGRLLRTLVVLLAERPGSVVSADRLTAELWGDAPPAKPANALQARVSQLRRLIVGAGADPALLARRGTGYALDVAPDDVDLVRFEQLATSGLVVAADPDAAREAVAAALALWPAELFPDLDGGAAMLQLRARLGELALSASERRLALDLEQGHHAAVVGEIEALVSVHPYREGLWAQLILALYRCGRQADALAAYQRARRILADELGLDPGPELQQLERSILTGTIDAVTIVAGADGPSPAPGPLRAPRRPRTPLVGRDELLAHLEQDLRAGHLVSLIGPGGVGKTRLALELADRWSGEVVVAELAARTGAAVLVTGWSRRWATRSCCRSPHRPGRWTRLVACSPRSSTRRSCWCPGVAPTTARSSSMVPTCSAPR